MTDSLIGCVSLQDCPNALFEVLEDLSMGEGSFEYLKGCSGLVVPLKDLIFL